MEVKIGVQQVQRELTVDVNESAEDVQKRVAEAVGSSDGVLTLTDSKGRTVVVPTAKLAYVEIGAGTPGTVGFRS